MEDLLQQVDIVAKSDSTVLIVVKPEPAKR